MATASIVRRSLLGHLHQRASRSSLFSLRQDREMLMETVQEIVKGGSSVQCLFFDEIRARRQEAVKAVQDAHKITDLELKKALQLGSRAIKEYLEDHKHKDQESTQLSPKLTTYVSNQLDDYKIPPAALNIQEKWITTPAALDWEVGTAFSDDNELEDAKVFSVNLVLSKFWSKILDERSVQAIIDHEIAHLGQNSENLEMHMLSALIDEKNRKSPASFTERRARKKAWQNYLYWTEYSADQVPALKSLDKAKGMKHFLSSLLMSVEIFNSPFHPANWRRKGSVNDILSALEAEQWLLSKKVCRNCVDFKHCQTNRSYYEKHHRRFPQHLQPQPLPAFQASYDS